jgi:hypothetical protein
MLADAFRNPRSVFRDQVYLLGSSRHAMLFK